MFLGLTEVRLSVNKTQIGHTVLCGQVRKMTLNSFFRRIL